MASNVLRALRGRELGQRELTTSWIAGDCSYPLRLSRLDMFEVACDVMTRLTAHLRFANPQVSGRDGLQYVACGGVFANWLVGDRVTFDELRFYMVYQYGVRMDSPDRIRSVLRDVVTEASLRGAEDDYETDNTAKSWRNLPHESKPRPVHLDGSTICRVRHRCGVHMRFLFSWEDNDVRDMLPFPDDWMSVMQHMSRMSAYRYDSDEAAPVTVNTEDSDESLFRAVRMRLVYLTEQASLRHKRVDNFDFLIPGLNNVVFALTSENDTADTLTHVCFLRRRHRLVDAYLDFVTRDIPTFDIILIGNLRVGGRQSYTRAPLHTWRKWCVQSRCCCCAPLTDQQMLEYLDLLITSSSSLVHDAIMNCYVRWLDMPQGRQICGMTEHACPVPSCPVDATGAGRRQHLSPRIPDESPQCSCRINQKPNCARYSVRDVRRMLVASEPSRLDLAGECIDHAE